MAARSSRLLALPELANAARTTFEWTLGGAFLLQQATVPVTEAPDGLCAFRHLIVYPQMLRHIERQWRTQRRLGPSGRANGSR